VRTNLIKVRLGVPGYWMGSPHLRGNKSVHCADATGLIRPFRELRTTIEAR